MTSDFGTDLEGWSLWDDASESHSYAVGWDNINGSPGAGSARLQGDYNISGGTCRAFGIQKTFTATGTHLDLSANYRATSSSSAASVTNFRVEILGSTGASLYHTKVLNGGTSNSGWQAWSETDIWLNNETSITVIFHMVDCWSIVYSHTLRMDHVVTAFSGSAPSVPGSLVQYRANGSTTISTGSSVADSHVRFKGTSTEADAEFYRIEVETRTTATAFTGVPNSGSPQTTSGNSTTTRGLETGGISGAALGFDGVDDYAISASLGDMDSVAPSFSIEVWFKPSPGGGNLISEFGQTSFCVPPSDVGAPTKSCIQNLLVRFHGPVIARLPGLADLELGSATFYQWNYAVLTYNATTDTLSGYLNNVAAGSVSGVATHPTSNTSYYVIGGRLGDASSSYDYPFRGVIDEVRISNKVRTALEVSNTWNSSNGTDFTADANTLVLYHFNEGSGQTVNDSAGTAQNATLGSNSGSVDSSDPTWDAHPTAGSNWHWQVRAVDVNGNLSAWTSYGGNSDTLTAATDYTISALTAVRLESFKAWRGLSHPRIEWTTAYELDNLGFHLYREDNGARVRVTPQLIESRLSTGRGSGLLGAQYAWEDVDGSNSSTYWLEAADISGTSTWHGPIVPQHRSSAPVRNSSGTGTLSLPLTSTSSSSSSASSGPTARMAERRATPPVSSDSAQQRQWQLAASSALQISVRREGWYRLSAPELWDLGFAAVDPRRLQLWVDGREIPIVVSGEEDGRLDETDAVEFHGVGLDSPHSLDRVYWLAQGDRPGKRVASIAPVEPRSSSPAKEALQTLVFEDKSLYFAALNNGDAENFFGPQVGTTPVSVNFPLSRVSPGAREAALEIALQGVTTFGHQISVAVNGTSVGTVDFVGRDAVHKVLPVDASLLVEGDNTVTLQSQGVATDKSLIARLALTFSQQARGAGRMTVTGRDEVRAEGLPSTGVSVYDVTDWDSTKRIPAVLETPGNSSVIRVVTPGEGQRTLMVVPAGTGLRPEALRVNEPSAWNTLVGANLIVLSHADFIPALTPFVERRTAQGWHVAVVDVQDIYDEFGQGSPTPWALRAFLRHAKASNPSLSHALLVGDASADPKRLLGLGSTDFVPTRLLWQGMLESASDDWLTDFDDDGVPEVALGRWPVHTVVDAEVVVEKTLQFEESLPEMGSRSLLVVNGQSQVTELEGGQQSLEQKLSTLPFSSSVLSPDVPALADEVKQRLGAGGFLVNYLGHGSTRIWEGLLQSSDVASLSENRSPPIILAMTCLNGFFQDVYGDSLAETFLRKPKGGAVAVWASSALGLADDQIAANLEVMRSLSEPGLSLGEAVKRAKAVTPDGVRKAWILFGDPTLLGRPSASSAMSTSQIPFTGAATPCGCSSGGSAPSVALALLVAWLVKALAFQRGRPSVPPG